MEESQIKHDEQEDVKVTKGQEEEEEEEKEEEEGEELQESLLSHAPSPSETPRFDGIFHKYDTGYG
jgi:hypothetical protein